MTKRVKRTPARRSPRLPVNGGPTFGEALREMRAAASEGVSEAIASATMLRPPPRAKGKPRVATGSQAMALFDGICEALADTVIDVSRPGNEEQIARLVGEILITHVQRKLCAGHA